MKRIALSVATVLMLVTFTAAQSGSFVVAEVPFSFHVQDTHASAGNYRISYKGNSNDFLVLSNLKDVNIVGGMNFQGRHPESSAVPKLVFHKYGDTYFLVAIGMPDRTVHTIPLGKESVVTHRLMTKVEREEVVVLAQLRK